MSNCPPAEPCLIPTGINRIILESSYNIFEFLQIASLRQHHMYRHPGQSSIHSRS